MNLFFTDEICSLVVNQSNLYAQEVLGDKYGEWKELTLPELRAYFGFMILMGLYPRPTLSDYWRCDPFVNYAPVSERISRDWFYEIHRHLHFTNNADLAPQGSPDYDRLDNVSSLINKVSERFLGLYHPH